MKPYSLTRRLIVTVLLMELLSALALTWLAVAYERHSRFRSFEIALGSRAATLFGAVGDADDPEDTLILDLHHVQLPREDLFDVETPDGKVLGRSAWWPSRQIDAQLDKRARDGIYQVTLDHHSYRFALIHAIRIIDPGKSGGVSRPVIVLYGASTGQVWGEVFEAVRFYAVASLLLLTGTGFALSWFLHSSLSPLAALAQEAARISAQQWSFHPPESTRSVAELAPLILALEAALKRLQQSFEQQRRFISNASHELKTDLATSKSSLQLLTLRKRSAEEYERGLEVCLVDTLRIEKTVTEMLILARVEYAESADRTPGVPLVADLALCLIEARTQFAGLAELRQITVLIQSPETAPVNIREEDARLLCTNLLLNALQHSRTTTQVIATIAASGPWFLLRIQDQGEGIDPEALPHVFEPFYRSDSARDRRVGGTGLGLAICKGICEKAGGEISIGSRPGQGTEVVVRLPAKETIASRAFCSS